MPFIKTNTNISMSDEQKLSLKEKLGKAIELLGKSERWLMISIEDNSTMYFKGEECPMAFVDVAVFGQSNDSQCESMCKEVCRIYGEELGIPADKIYVKFSGSNQWGWNNMMF